MVSLKFNTESQEETFAFGEKLGRLLNSPCVLLLHGGMGMGKTLFTKGFVLGMGILDDVTSPTYTIVNSYGEPPGVFHFDLYRLRDIEELYEMGFEDYLSEEAILILEWPDLAMDYSFRNKVDIFIDFFEGSSEKRQITLKTENPELINQLNKP